MLKSWALKWQLLARRAFNSMDMSLTKPREIVKDSNLEGYSPWGLRESNMTWRCQNYPNKKIKAKILQERNNYNLISLMNVQFKVPLQNTSKSNPTMNKKCYTPWLSRTYSWCTRLVQYLIICNTLLTVGFL